MKVKIPNSRFLTDMGVASILAGIILLGLAHATKKFK